MKKLLIRVLLKREIVELLKIRPDPLKKPPFDYSLGVKSGIERSIYKFTGLNY